MGSKMHTAGDNLRDASTSLDSQAETASATSTGSDYWLSLAKDAYTQSESYFDANIRRGMEKNIAHFNSDHAPGSKYFSESYKHRAKGFRSKTRATVRRNEAAAAKAMFSTSDAVSITAERGRDESQRTSAEINKALLNYRLKNTIPWFPIAMGAYQDALVTGVTISHQYWNYREVEDKMPDEDDEDELLSAEGEDIKPKTTSFTVVKDTPAIELRPVENFLFSPSANWEDVIGTSAYLIDRLPMTIDDVMLLSKQTQKTQIPWLTLTEEELLIGATTDYDAVRSQRESQREDSKDQRYTHRGFQTVWVHRNIIRQDGRDWLYYTLDIHTRLSDPIPLEMEYPHLRAGERPYVLGFCNIEAHKVYPESPVSMLSGVQQEANDINNQRRDNVALVLNRRYFVNRNAAIDYSSLIRNVPGAVTEMDNPREDIRVEAPPDVTNSSYQEQDRVNADFDELSGGFNVSSVNTNRKLNETVGGMELLAASADEVTEYQLRVWVETWVEPVLKQIVRLEQRHESDEGLLTLIGEDIKMWQRFGVNKVTDLMIQGNMTVEVNVGFGATNPQQRINKLALAFSTIGAYAPQMAQSGNEQEVIKEILGAVGYKDTERFFPPADPEAAPEPPPQQPMTEFEQAKLAQEREIAEMKLKSNESMAQMKVYIADKERETQMMRLAMEENISIAQLDRDLKGMETDRQNKVDEMNIKLKVGSGI